MMIKDIVEATTVRFGVNRKEYYSNIYYHGLLIYNYNSLDPSSTYLKINSSERKNPKFAKKILMYHN